MRRCSQPQITDTKIHKNTDKTNVSVWFLRDFRGYFGSGTEGMIGKYLHTILPFPSVATSPKIRGIRCKAARYGRLYSLAPYPPNLYLCGRLERDYIPRPFLTLGLLSSCPVFCSCRDSTAGACFMPGVWACFGFRGSLQDSL